MFLKSLSSVCAFASESIAIVLTLDLDSSKNFWVSRDWQFGDRVVPLPLRLAWCFAMKRRRRWTAEARTLRGNNQLVCLSPFDILDLDTMTDVRGSRFDA